mgnify:CR=1 FL=1
MYIERLSHEITTLNEKLILEKHQSQEYQRTQKSKFKSSLKHSEVHLKQTISKLEHDNSQLQSEIAQF